MTPSPPESTPFPYTTLFRSGQAGFERHLDTGEIVEQVVRAQHVTTTRVSHVVFMGMGEPLANVEPVLGALDRLHDDFGLSRSEEHTSELQSHVNLVCRLLLE